MRSKKIVIVGCGGHAASIIDSIEGIAEFDIVGYTEIEDKQINSLDYLGTDDILSNLFSKGIEYAAIGIGFLGGSYRRDKVYKILKTIGFKLPIITDKTAIVSPNSSVGEGTFIGKGCVINAGVVIGKMCIINSGAIIEHNDYIGDFTHIAVGAVLCGHVSVGDHSLIGANSTILQELTIGSNTIIGGGSIVIKNVDDNVTRYGKIGGGYSST